MNLNTSIRTKIFTINLLKKNISFLFFTYFNSNLEEFNNFLIFLKHRNLQIIYIPRKQINNILNNTLSNDVVINNFKNYDFNIINLSLFELKDFSLLFYLFLFSKENLKINYLFLKINNLFLSASFFKQLFKKILALEFHSSVSIFYLYFFNIFLHIKIIFFKYIYFFKFLLILKFYKELYTYI